MVRKAGNASQKRPINQWNNGNPLEAFKDLASDFRRGLTDDLLKGTARDLFSETEELFGLKPQKKLSGTLNPEEVLDLKALEVTQEEIDIKYREGPKPAFRQPAENFLFLQKERGIQQEIEALLLEIKREVKRFDEATRNLEKETAKIVVEEIPPSPGIYHINFFEWLLGLLKNIRQKVEDANVWLSVLQSKKAKKGYWSQFKKHGTSFGLSGERVVATQTG